MRANQQFKTVRSDVQALLKESQDLFVEAAAASGKTAEDLRAKGQEILDQAMDKAQQAQSLVLDTGREIVATTDDYVQSNPWRAIAISTGIGVLVGLVVSRCGEPQH
ncbi:DUF883 family protein [Herbaspirillum lusitanum]|uniref:DUF883 family protein n=1 Tax=Herbaspirillum lusitanum TaxID=213312 RepID=A0ABW9A4R0_9BURK